MQPAGAGSKLLIEDGDLTAPPAVSAARGVSRQAANPLRSTHRRAQIAARVSASSAGHVTRSACGLSSVRRFAIPSGPKTPLTIVVSSRNSLATGVGGVGNPHSLPTVRQHDDVRSRRDGCRPDRTRDAVGVGPTVRSGRGENTRSRAT
jgi:hypothetical protein